jgi:hypothetical protein
MYKAQDTEGKTHYIEIVENVMTGRQSMKQKSLAAWAAS